VSNCERVVFDSFGSESHRAGPIPSIWNILFLSILALSATPLRSVATIALIQGPGSMLIEDVASASRVCDFCCQPGPGSRLEPAINSLKSLKRIQELETDLPHLICARPELLHILNGKPDPVDRDTRLIGEFKFHGYGLGVRPLLNQRKYLVREFALHAYGPSRSNSQRSRS
jgi:hypothetical protein